MRADEQDKYVMRCVENTYAIVGGKFSSGCWGCALAGQRQLDALNNIELLDIK